MSFLELYNIVKHGAVQTCAVYMKLFTDMITKRCLEDGTWESFTNYHACLNNTVPPPGIVSHLLIEKDIWFSFDINLLPVIKLWWVPRIFIGLQNIIGFRMFKTFTFTYCYFLFNKINSEWSWEIRLKKRKRTGRHLYFCSATRSP